MPNIVPRGGDIAKVVGKVPRITRANIRDIRNRIASNTLTDDDILALREVIKKDIANYGSLTAAEDEAFRALSSRILGKRTIEGDFTKSGRGGQRVETPFDDLYEQRDELYGRGKTQTPMIGAERKLLE